MAPKKTPPSRPPRRVKTSLPAPRVAPKRVHVAWFKRPAFLGVAGLVVVIVAIIGLNRGLDFLHHRHTYNRIKNTVKTYDGKLQTNLSTLGTFLSQAENTPPEFLSGTVTQTAFAEEVAEWQSSVTAFRTQVQDANTPTALGRASALMIQGADLMLDGINQFQLAASTTSLAEATTLIQDATNTTAHAEAVLSDGAQLEAQKVAGYGLALPNGETRSNINSLPEAPPVSVTVTPQPSPT